MKKILVINTKYREYGGEDSNILEELKFLKQYYKVEYLEYDNSEPLNISDILSFLFKLNIKSNLKLRKKLKKFNPDIVYIHNTWFKAGLGIFKILENFDCKVVVKVHNFRYFCTQSFSAKGHLNGENFCFKCGFKGVIFNRYFKESFLKSFFIILYSKKYLKIFRNNSIKILVLNTFHKETLSSLEIPINKIEIFYNPLNLDSIGNIKYNPNSSYFVYAGRLSDSKGIIELLESWKSADLTNIELRIIGQGEMTQLIQENLYEENIKFMGQLSNEEVIDQIKYSKGVITATKMQEGQPRILNEASVLGVPSIFPKFGGMNEYFPKNYQFSFQQYNYKDLTSKILEFSESDNLIEVSEKLMSFTKKLLDANFLAVKFEKIVE